MKSSQILYDSALTTIIGSRKLNPFNYFRTLQSIKERKTQYPLVRKFLIKKMVQMPCNNYYVMESNKKYLEKLEDMRKTKVVPKLNSVFLEFETRIRNNKEKVKENEKRSLTLENRKYNIRINNQQPKVLRAKYLNELFKKTHDKYFELLLRNSRFQKNGNKSNKIKHLVQLPSISGYLDGMFSPLRTKTEFLTEKDNDREQSNDNSVEQRDHKQSEIYHQKQGHIDN